MRPYRTEEYKRKLIGNTFRDSGSDYKQHDGKKVQESLKRKEEAQGYERVEAQCLDCLSGILGGAVGRGDAGLPPMGRKGGAR